MTRCQRDFAPHPVGDRQREADVDQRRRQRELQRRRRSCCTGYGCEKKRVIVREPAALLRLERQHEPVDERVDEQQQHEQHPPARRAAARPVEPARVGARSSPAMTRLARDRPATRSGGTCTRTGRARAPTCPGSCARADRRAVGRDERRRASRGRRTRRSRRVPSMAFAPRAAPASTSSGRIATVTRPRRDRLLRGAGRARSRRRAARHASPSTRSAVEVEHVAVAHEARDVQVGRAARTAPPACRSAATSPSCSTTMRSASDSASSWSCVT